MVRALAAAAVAALLTTSACNDANRGAVPSEPSGDKAGEITTRVAPDVPELGSAVHQRSSPSLSLGASRPAASHPSFAITVVAGDTTNEQCRQGQEFCAIQSQAAGGYVWVSCLSIPGSCQTGSYEWSIQSPPPKSTTTFAPDTTAIDQFARVTIQTTDSTPPDIYQVTFVPRPLNGSPTPSPPTVQGLVHVLCSYKLKSCPKIEIRDRTRSDTVVSEPSSNPPTQSTLIGKHMKLRVSADTTTYQLIYANWGLGFSDPADLVKSYALETGQLTALNSLNGLDDPNGLTISYYYVVARNGYRINAEAKLTLRNNPDRVFYPEAGAKYDAKGPSVPTLVDPTMPVQVGLFDARGDTALSLGTTLSRPNSSGIHLIFTATAAPNDTNGYVAATQLIQVATDYVRNPAGNPNAVIVPSTNGAYFLDACSLYRGTPVGKNFVQAQGGNYTYEADDAPASYLTEDFNSVTRRDDFKTFFMFRPSGSESIWVPIYLVPWSWGGTATRNTLLHLWPPPPTNVTQPAAPRGATTSAFPQWPEIFQRDTACAALPAS
jgi:hypothetical protein